VTAGLRERKKADTRRTLSDVAVRLCLEHGYQAVTVGQIAEAAGVSRRTFSNYFAGKAECVCAYGEGTLDETLSAVVEAPPGTPLPVLLGLALDRFAERFSSGLAFLARREPELQAFVLLADTVDEQRIAEAIAHTLHADAGDIRIRVFVAGCIAAARIVSDDWLDADRPGGTAELSRRLQYAFGVFDLDALTR
jgi:AcrR family transcriptional regulator